MSVLQLIEQEMTNDQLVVRSHIEDFNAKSRLIVYESQEAIFFKNGQALDLFPAGAHTLSSENVPILKKFFNHLFGGKTPLPCDVYFINKVNVLDIPWGTDSPIQLEDPKYPMLVSVCARAQMGIRVKDSRRFLVSVVGQLREYTVMEVRRAIKGMMTSSIKETIASAIVEKKISILEVTTKLSELSEVIQQKLNAKVDKLGLEAIHFNLVAIEPSDGDLDALKRMKDTVMESYGRRQSRDIEGYTYFDERRFDILEGAANNTGGAGGNFINMGVGLGMGAGIGREVSNMYQGMTQTPQPSQPAQPAAGKACPACGAAVTEGAKFCMSCGQPIPQAPAAKFCPECGTRCEGASKFCMNCGQKLG